MSGYVEYCGAGLKSCSGYNMALTQKYNSDVRDRCELNSVQAADLKG